MQPRVKGAGLASTFRQYNNLGRVLPRMRRLLAMLRGSGAEFVTAREYLKPLLRTVPA